MSARPLTDGFTLLEVLIAVAILAITLSVLYGSQTQSLSLATEAKFNTRASLLLQQKFSEIQAGVEDLYESEGDFGDENPGFLWKIEIDDFDSMESEIFEDLDGIKRLRLTVSWENSPYSESMDYYYVEGE